MAYIILLKIAALVIAAKDRFVDWLEDSQGQSYQSAYSLLIGVDRQV